MSWRRPEDVLKTSWRRLEDIWPRQIYWSWPRCLEDVLKTSSEDVWLIRIYSSSSRRLEDVLKTSFEDEDERRRQDVFIKMNICRGKNKFYWWTSSVLIKWQSSASFKKQHHICFTHILRTPVFLSKPLLLSNLLNTFEKIHFLLKNHKYSLPCFSFKAFGNIVSHLPLHL